MSLYREMISESIAIAEGRLPKPRAHEPAETARHEAAHVVVALALDVPVLHTYLSGSTCSFSAKPHTCSEPGDPVRRAAIAWAGAVHDRSLYWSAGDFTGLAGVGAHTKPGQAFDLAESILRDHADVHERIAAALLELGVLVTEQIEALIF